MTSLIFVGVVVVLVWLAVVAIIVRLLTYYPIRCPNCLNKTGITEIEGNKLHCRACGRTWNGKEKSKNKE